MVADRSKQVDRWRSNNGGKDVAPNEAKITIISHSTAMAKLPDISDR